MDKMINYLEEFPFPREHLPELLGKMLTPINNFEPSLMVEITTFNSNVDMEHFQMIMATVPEAQLSNLVIMEGSESGVIASSTPICETKGELANISYTLDGYDYLVSSWGCGNFFTYSLSDKVWMSLGLSQRCVGNDIQELIYDDLSAPIMTVARGQGSCEYNFNQNRNIIWTMRNDYLRNYLWMRGHAGVRSFFYQSKILDNSEIRALMNGESQYINEPENGWYRLDIREHQGGLLLKVKATVIAILPEKCPEENIYGLIWPGDHTAMTKAKIKPFPLNTEYPYIYLHDTFLEKYEKNSLYDSVPHITSDDICTCSPSYKGQWSFVGFERIKRNIIRVSVYDLYNKAIPDREILHAYSYAMSPEHAASFDEKQENIVQKSKRLVNEVLRLGNLFCLLSSRIGLAKKTQQHYIGISSKRIYENGWRDYPIINKLAAVAPLNMSEADFLSRCKTLHEFILKISLGPLKEFLIKAGISDSDLKGIGNLKLLEKLKNILDFLVEQRAGSSSWSGTAKLCDWNQRNITMASLFINNDLRIADAHEVINKAIKSLETLGFDSGQLAAGYGAALDFIFDEICKSIQGMNDKIKLILLEENWEQNCPLLSELSVSE